MRRQFRHIRRRFSVLLIILLAHVVLTATYSMMGREKEARAEAAEVLRINPKFSLDYFAKALPFKDQSVTDNHVDAFRKAGLK